MSQEASSNYVIPDRSTKGPVSFDNDVSFEWVEDGQIAIFTLKHSTRASVDTYVNVYTAFLEQNRGKTVYLLNDATAPDISPSSANGLSY